MSRPSPRVYRQVETFARLAHAEDQGWISDVETARRELLALGFEVRPLGAPEGVKPVATILDAVMARVVRDSI